jgi:hypothetical protein
MPIAAQEGSDYGRHTKTHPRRCTGGWLDSQCGTMRSQTYPLALLAVAHTFGYQYLNLRGPVLLVMVIIPLVMVLACQGLGIVLTVSQQRRG